MAVEQGQRKFFVDFPTVTKNQSGKENSGPTKARQTNEQPTSKSDSSKWRRIKRNSTPKSSEDKSALSPVQIDDENKKDSDAESDEDFLLVAPGLSGLAKRAENPHVLPATHTQTLKTGLRKLATNCAEEDRLARVCLSACAVTLLPFTVAKRIVPVLSVVDTVQCGGTITSYWHILSTDNLRNFSRQVPMTIEELKAMESLGENIIEQYGDRIVKMITAFIETNKLGQYADRRPMKRLKRTVVAATDIDFDAIELPDEKPAAKEREAAFALTSSETKHSRFFSSETKKW